MINHIKNHKLKRDLESLIKIKRYKHHKLLHHIHKKHGISHKTLFYIKEYGPHTNVVRTIIKESIKILLFASIISSFGGLALESIKNLFITIIPLVILFPTLNDMVGDYGSIVASRFSTMLHENKVKKEWWKNREIKKLFFEIFSVAILTTLISIVISIIISYYSNYFMNDMIIIKIFLITMIDVISLVIILFFVSILAGIHYYKKKEDPNNFLIPIATSIADFGNMIILAVLVILFF